jgi:hypothetical protein
VRALLGPILLIQDVAWGNQVTGVVLCLLLVPCLASFFFRPRWWSAILSTSAALAWLIIGNVGMGINC